MNIALVTCSYAPDLERCRLLCRSVDRFVASEIQHVLVVPRRDRHLFADLASPRRTIIEAESVLPRWVRRVPLSRRWWITPCSPPVRGWIMQQITKVAAAATLDSDVVVFADSELVFVRPFEAPHVHRDGQVRLYRRPGDGQRPSHERWHRRAGRLLGLPETEYFGADYIGPLVSWRRANALKLIERIEAMAGKTWQIPLCRSLHLSEYILYGVFCEHVLGEQSEHYYDSARLCHVAWRGQVANDDELQRFLRGVEAHHLAVLIQSNLGIPVERYERLLHAHAVLS